MKPVDLKTEGYLDVVEFAKHQDQYMTLPAIRSKDGSVWTLWQPSEAEAKAIAAGARVALRLWTFDRPLQPVALSVEGVEEEDVEARAAAGPPSVPEAEGGAPTTPGPGAV